MSSLHDPSLLTFIAVVVVAVIALRALLRIDRSLQELVQRSRVVDAQAATPLTPTR